MPVLESSMSETVAFIKVEIKEKDGRYYASSADLPGLHLCGDSLRDVRDDVGPMIERMYLINKGLRVKAAPAADAMSLEVPKAPKKSGAGGFFRYWASPLAVAA